MMEQTILDTWYDEFHVHNPDITKEEIKNIATLGATFGTKIGESPSVVRDAAMHLLWALKAIAYKEGISSKNGVIQNLEDVVQKNNVIARKNQAQSKKISKRKCKYKCHINIPKVYPPMNKAWLEQKVITSLTTHHFKFDVAKTKPSVTDTN